MTIEREHGPALVPRWAPGYDDLMPHDLAHFLVEEFFGIQLGVWGQLAAGGGGIFTPAPEDTTLRLRRRVQRIGSVGRQDMARSERLVVLTVAAWERGIGRLTGPTRTVPDVEDADAARLPGAVLLMTDVAGRWGALGRGGSITRAWPSQLTTFDAARSHRGRRTGPRAPGPVRPGTALRRRSKAS